MKNQVAPLIKRIRWIDVAKGLAIILVVLGHAASPLAASNISAKFILNLTYTIHMPVFFYLAGLANDSFSKKNLSIHKQIQSKFIRLLVPYFTFSIINGCLIYGGSLIPQLKSFLYQGDFPGIISFIMEILFQVRNKDVHLWFAYYLFVYSVISILIQSCTCDSKKTYRALFTLVLLVSVLILPIMPEFYLSDVISKYIFWSGYYLAGCIHLHENIERKNIVIKAGICIGIGINTLYAMFLDDIHQYNMIYWILRIIVGYTSIAYIILISKCIDTYMNSGIVAKIEYLGRRSFVIYILHQPFITVGFVVVFSYIFQNNGQIITIVLTTILGVLIPLLIDKSIRSNWMRMILFGEKKTMLQ